MKIDGKAIADRILTELAQKVKTLGKTPTLAVILVGDNPASLAYIKQKQKAAETIGANVILKQFSETSSKQQIDEAIHQYNNDRNVHGIIVQRPIPEYVGDITSVVSQKDVDGFLPTSPFTPPVALAVLEILKEAAKTDDFDSWLRNQCSVVFGRGETAGAPIARVLETRGCTIEIVHSQTPDPSVLTKKFNIIVSCVGRERVITAPMLTPQSILIGVGIWRDSEGKLRGDYNEEEIQDVVAYYTPTPGGVGPVNVASLMQNLVKAYTMSL